MPAVFLATFSCVRSYTIQTRQRNGDDFSLDPKTLEQYYLCHFRMVWNLCYTYLRNVQDVEDAVQDTFLRLAAEGNRFSDPEHVKAWLIVTSKNVCKDELKKARRKNLSLEDADGRTASIPEPDETLEAVRSLPLKLRTAIYFFYYEGLSTRQIAELLDRKESTVRSDLHRGRTLLRKALERSYK